MVDKQDEIIKNHQLFFVIFMS